MHDGEQESALSDSDQWMPIRLHEPDRDAAEGAQAKTGHAVKSDHGADGRGA
jgi:hypothetical protein